jgi:diaminopimelate decarboxylase
MFDVHQFLFRFDRPFFWPAAGLNPERLSNDFPWCLCALVAIIPLYSNIFKFRIAERQAMSIKNLAPRLWWERKDLGYRKGRLFLGNRDLLEFVQSAGTPVYLYNSARIKENLTRLAQALAKREIKFKIFYALKANRFLPLVTYLKMLGQCGVDVCSPGELQLARQVGFNQNEITYTGTSISSEDLDCLQRNPHVWINCDAISTIKRLGERCPGRAIGVRINPQLGAGYHAGLHYAGKKATKFGIYQDRFQEAISIARHYDLPIKVLHFHIGSGYLTPDLATLDEILERCHWFLDRCPTIDALDIGGGLGIPIIEGQEPLDIDQWAGIISKHAKKRNLEIILEPGDYLVKDCGILILQVNTVEDKGGTKFIGVNGGFNLQNLPAYYNMPLIIAPLSKDPTAPPEQVTIAGNINEGIDLLAKDISLPPIHEGDYLGFLTVGGYGAAASSNHCMRGTFSEYFLID